MVHSTFIIFIVVGEKKGGGIIATLYGNFSKPSNKIYSMHSEAHDLN